MHGYGDSGVKCCRTEEEERAWTGVMLANVIETVDKLAGLEHIHSHKILLRAIKPENLLCALNDSAIKIVDFGISKPFSHRQPLKERRVVIGSLHWAKLNSHIKKDLAPPDDLESLAYIALSLLCGNLPQKPHAREESQMRLQEVVGQMKPESSGKDLQALVWEYGATRRWVNDEPKFEVPREGEVDNDNGGDGLGEDNYFAMDLDMLERQGERDKNFILLVEQEADLDSGTPLIAEALQE
ncbi:uncharacterized protein ARMOST_06148 [Armillaria ostoyae]|uniref:Protein kinase domain-containing protein n=1 Tax=Armillaria ostoyae TaxID=47428 RepID=A0A284R259_ARMOS|nr:uncharacterized protein ARMOST_06148 [Armillaria ostoyae]